MEVYAEFDFQKAMEAIVFYPPKIVTHSEVSN